MHQLIVFEGIDGAGKATQVKMLAERLRAQGKRVTVFSSPRYETPTGKLVRAALEGAYGDFVGLSPYFSALPYLLDFAASRDEIRAALKKGMVICDRHVPSTVAYHSAKLSGAKAKEFIRLVEHVAYTVLGVPEPTLVVYLHLPVGKAQELMHKKKKDQHERDTGYQARVAKAYALLAKRKNWRTVESVKGGKMRSVQDIHEEIVRLVS